MGNVALKPFFIVLLIAIGLAVTLGLYFNVLRFGSESYKCLGGNRFYTAVPMQKALSIGPVQWYYQPYTWGCPEERQYNPKDYEVNNGMLVPKAD